MQVLDCAAVTLSSTRVRCDQAAGGWSQGKHVPRRPSPARFEVDRGAWCSAPIMRRDQTGPVVAEKVSPFTPAHAIIGPCHWKTGGVFWRECAARVARQCILPGSCRVTNSSQSRLFARGCGGVPVVLKGSRQPQLRHHRDHQFKLCEAHKSNGRGGRPNFMGTPHIPSRRLVEES